jgi:hypothetical protein
LVPSENDTADKVGFVPYVIELLGGGIPLKHVELGSKLRRCFLICASDGMEYCR